MCQLTRIQRNVQRIAPIDVNLTVSKKWREDIVGLVVCLSHLMLTVAGSAGVTDGTTSQPGIQVQVIGLAGAMLTFGSKGFPAFVSRRQKITY